MPKILQKIVKKYRNYKLYNHTVNELSSLSDKDLKDIGISRSEIKSIAKSNSGRRAR